MVQQVPGPSSLPQGNNYYAPRDNQWARNERNPPYLDNNQDSRLASIAPAHEHDLKPTVENALRHCIPVEKFALLVQLNDGTLRTFSSASLQQCHERLFTSKLKKEFHQCIIDTSSRKPFSSSAFNHDGISSDFDTDGSHAVRKQSSSGGSSIGNGRRQHRQSRSEDSEDGSYAKKRRMRGHPGRNRDRSDDETPVPVQERQFLTIGKEDEVEQFYRVRFKDMHQSACKVMAKAFVKLVEPKKQTHHPYTKGDEKKPPWWPETTGEEGVRHREPDHLLKPERIRLLVHILKMIVRPVHKQPSSVQKLNLNVAKLREVTMEVMSNWFADKEHPQNESKRPFLKEIFKVAAKQEMCLDGGLDKGTHVTVSYGDRLGLDEDSDVDEQEMEDEEIQSETMAGSVHTNASTEPLISPSTVGHNQNLLELDQAQMRPRPGLPMRHNTTQLEEMSYQDQSFFASRNMGYQSQSPTDMSRRPFGSPVYTTSQQAMYPPPWSNAMAAPSQSANYYSAPQQPAYTPAITMLPPLNSQHMGSSTLHSSYDGMPRYDLGPSPGNQLRTGSLGHPHQLHHTYPDYMQEGFQSHHEMKEEPQHPHL